MKRLLVTFAVAGFALCAGIAYASIPDSGGVIHGCYANKDGNLRVIDTGSGGACDAKKETPLNWNQKGPTGARGPTGPTGTSHGYYSYGGLLSFTVLGGSFGRSSTRPLAVTTYVPAGRPLSFPTVLNDPPSAVKLRSPPYE